MEGTNEETAVEGPQSPVKPLQPRPRTIISTGPVKRAKKPAMDYIKGLICFFLAIFIAAMGSDSEYPASMAYYAIAVLLFLGGIHYLTRQYHVDMASWFKDTSGMCDHTGNEGQCIRTSCTKCVFAAEYLKRINDNRVESEGRKQL